jgi:hypothetical protein
MCWTCNELGAGYAADGFARKRGVAACIVTFCVGESWIEVVVWGWWGGGEWRRVCQEAGGGGVHRHVLRGLVVDNSGTACVMVLV